MEYDESNVSEIQKKIAQKCINCVMDGFQLEKDGTNYNWPYTLDYGSPNINEDGIDIPIGHYKGLWEAPVNPVIVPPDDKCIEYGVEIGLRTKLGVNSGGNRRR